jgi:hypothetical protein
MKEIVKIILRIIMLLIILFLVTRIFRRADQGTILSATTSFYSRGNAPDSIRQEIVTQLKKFQDGYSKRDTGKADAFMQSLYSKENILILGTMPREIFVGYERAGSLVKSDWESWGDCSFAVDNASISSSGNTAWFATRGYVKFDISRFLVIPLRFTGIMVKEDQEWKFRQQQFQFDIDFSFSLLATLLLFAWILISLVSIAIKLKNYYRFRNQDKTGQK